MGSVVPLIQAGRAEFLAQFYITNGSPERPLVKTKILRMNFARNGIPAYNSLGTFRRSPVWRNMYQVILQFQKGFGRIFTI